MAVTKPQLPALLPAHASCAQVPVRAAWARLQPEEQGQEASGDGSAGAGSLTEAPWPRAREARVREKRREHSRPQAGAVDRQRPRGPGHLHPQHVKNCCAPSQHEGQPAQPARAEGLTQGTGHAGACAHGSGRDQSSALSRSGHGVSRPRTGRHLQGEAEGRVPEGGGAEQGARGPGSPAQSPAAPHAAEPAEGQRAT